MHTRIQYSIHAQAVMAERGIRDEWVEVVLAAPEWTEMEPRSPGRYRAFGRIPEHGDRMLRVVYDKADDGVCVVTAFFDRAHLKR